MWKISDMHVKAEGLTPIMFQHLLMSAALTDTRMVTTRVEYDKALHWVKKVVADAAVAERMTVEANKYEWRFLRLRGILFR